jgi:exodeoxyribonuclease VII large subunit
MKITPVTLLELNRQIKKAVKDNIETCWIIGEISELKVNYSGHCYLELIQKDEVTDQVVARSKATIWASFFRMIKPYFESTTGQSLSPGLSIMVKVSAEFHELYGMSLNITDIEPTYTVGELALRRQKIIERLHDEGVIDMNKELEFPYLCRKIAVISSVTAAGFEDFTNQLLGNHDGYKFYIKLFPAAMQGNEAEDSIIAALEHIYEFENFFDVVVIIRGGGSKSDLGCFDNYRIAYYITQFPLPVITGIGHEQDDSVTDLVAHTRLKTPTAVAAFLIDRMTELDGNLQMIQEQLLQRASEIVDDHKDNIHDKAKDLQLLITRFVSEEGSKLFSVKHKLASGTQSALFRLQIAVNRNETLISQKTKNVIVKSKAELQRINSLLEKSIQHELGTNKSVIEFFERQIKQLDPQKLLEKGYSITKKNGKLISKSSEAAEGELIETILYEGKLMSQIKKS